MNQLLLKKMLDISGRMVATRELEPLLQLALKEAIALVDAEYGYLLFLEADGSYSFPVHLKYDGSVVTNPNEQVSHSILYDAMTAPDGIILSDAIHDPDRNKAESVRSLGVRSVMCVPLITPDKTIGAIYLENRSHRNQFQPEDLQPLRFFANQAASSIENALLIKELESRVKQRTAQLEKSWHETIEANRVRNELLSNVAHDIRAPMGIVMGTLSLMKNQMLGQISDEQQQWVTKALEASRHVKNLTSDLLDISKMHLQQLRLSCVETDIPQFLQHLHEVAQGLPWSEKVEFYLEIASKPFPPVPCDHVRLQQIIFNLLNNALKFTNQGSVTLYARPLPNTEGVLIGVSDTGEGIAPESMSLIFERFYQHDENTERRAQGNGLGLAICRELVQMHNGRIWAQANSHGGADILFTLPATHETKENGR